MTEVKEVQINTGIELIRAIIGEEWKIAYGGNLIICTHRSYKQSFTIMLQKWDNTATFDIRVGALSEENNPTIPTLESKYYKAIGALQTNPCTKVIASIFANF